VECGKAGNAASEAHAAAFIEAALHLDHIPERVGSDHDLALYHTVAIAKVPAQVRFAFGDASEAADNEVWFEPELDHLNFQDLPVGTRLARVAGGCAHPVVVHDESGQEVTDRYLEVRQGELRTRAAFMPAMLTLSAQAIRQDCLCYIMERLPHPT
jgi:hypothetical protein